MSSKSYLGDGVYVEYEQDTVMFKLTTEDDIRVIDTIFLEWPVYRALKNYVDHVEKEGQAKNSDVWELVLNSFEAAYEPYEIYREEPQITAIQDLYDRLRLLEDRLTTQRNRDSQELRGIIRRFEINISNLAGRVYKLEA